jgi:hypothetical protein
MTTTTWTERLNAIGSVVKTFWYFALVIGLVFGVLLLSRACNRANVAEAALARANKTAALKDAGFLVAVQTDRKTLNAQAKALDTIPGFQAEIARLRKATQGSRVVRVGHIETEPRLAEGLPRPPVVPGAPCPECMFAAGDQGKLVIDSVDLESKEGVQVAVVGGGCERIVPAPPTRFLSGLGSAPLSTASAESVPLKSSPGWGGGLAGGIGTTGLVGSAIILTPGILGDHIAAVGLVSAGPGLLSAQAGIIFRP